MSMRLLDKILASRRGDPQTALAYLDRPDTKDAEYVVSLWKWCGVAGVDFAIAYAWFLVETDEARSRRWLDDNNPGGIAIPADSTVQPFAIPDGDAAARLHVQCLFALVARATHADIPLWPEALNWMLRVWLPKVTDPRFPRVERLTDLDIRYRDSYGEMQSTWAWGHQEGQPAQAAIAKAHRVWPNLSDQQEEPSMPTYTDLVFHNDVIGTQANAPNVPLNDTNELWIVVHETANTNVGAGAKMHYDFVRNGGGSSGVSFTFAVDDREARQILRADRIGYHAADGCNNRQTDIGCFAAVAIETCVNADGNWAKTKDNLAKLIAMIVMGDDRIIGLRKGAFSFDRVTTHQKVSDTGKWCPTRMLNEGSLPVIIAQAKRYAAVDEGPSYAPPITYPWLEPDVAAEGKDRQIGETDVYYQHLVYTAVRDTPRKRHAGDEVIGPPIKKGESFAADFAYRSHGVSYVLTQYGTRVTARDLAPRIGISTRGTITIRRTPA